ncbi:hypothetical protein MMC29_000058 [Sticta canariensis]|nr:hypothetical protein [Sticta canariensis]
MSDQKKAILARPEDWDIQEIATALSRHIGPRTASILEDGLAKPLCLQRNHDFVRLLGLKDLPGNNLKENRGKGKDGRGLLKANGGKAKNGCDPKDTSGTGEEGQTPAPQLEK